MYPIFMQKTVVPRVAKFDTLIRRDRSALLLELRQREREREREIACMSGRNEPCLVPVHAVNAMLVRTIAVIICRHIFIVCVAL